MGALLFVIGIGFIATLVFLSDSYDVTLIGFLGTWTTISLVVAFFFWLMGAWDDTPAKTEGTVVVKEERVKPPTEETKESPPEEQKKEEPPPEEKKTEEKDWFQEWSDSNVKDARISCTPDGNQVYVIAWLYTEGSSKGTPQSFTVYPRLHQDGTPFTCEEGKDPQKEEPL